MEVTLKHEVYLARNNTIVSFAINTKDWRAEYALKRERIEKESAQIKYCNSQNLPIFMQGNCYKCNSHVVDKYLFSECSSMLITGCRNCNKSFVD